MKKRALCAIQLVLNGKESTICINLLSGGHISRKLNPDEILPSGYARNQTWIALCKSWNGFLLAKRECDPSDMKQYIGQIRKLQKESGLRQTEFEGYSPAELASIDLENDEDFWMEKYGATV